MFKIINAKSHNLLPTDEIQDQLDQLGDGWEIVSHQVSSVVAQTLPEIGRIGAGPGIMPAGFPTQMVYVISIILKKS